MEINKMQGIYQGFELYTHDTVWSVILDLVQNHEGMSFAEDAFDLIEQSGSATILRERNIKGIK